MIYITRLNRDVCKNDACAHFTSCPVFAVALHLFQVIIGQNAGLPTSRSRTYVTLAHRQSVIDLKVYEGDRYYTADCEMLMQFGVAVPPRLAGEASIVVCFALDVNGKIVAVRGYRVMTEIDLTESDGIRMLS